MFIVLLYVGFFNILVEKIIVLNIIFMWEIKFLSLCIMSYVLCNPYKSIEGIEMCMKKCIDIQKNPIISQPKKKIGQKSNIG